MKLRNCSLASSDRDIRFTSPSQASNAPWGQFDRIELAAAEQSRLDGWRKIIDRTLIEWGCHPDNIEDDGVDPPTAAAIARANLIVCELRDEGTPLPANLAPNGDGGIVLHYEFGDAFLTIEVDSIGDCELRVLENGRLTKQIVVRPE